MKTAYKIGVLGLLACGSYFAVKHLQPHLLNNPRNEKSEWPDLGETAYIYNGVAIYSNGDEVYESHGKHYSSDGYYYGRKWQCVEFIKRYLYDAHGHRMPDVWGHAKSFFDPAFSQGQFNTARNLWQFRNYQNEPPKKNDLLVWGGKYGHVAIVSEVHQDHIIIVQQNIKNLPVARIPLTLTDQSTYILGDPTDSNKPLGWLRIP